MIEKIQQENRHLKLKNRTKNKLLKQQEENLDENEDVLIDYLINVCDSFSQHLEIFISLNFTELRFIKRLDVYHFLEVVKIFVAPFVKLYQL